LQQPKHSLERWLRLTRSRLRPTTLSSPAVERGFCVFIFDNQVVMNINFQAPLSGEAEERVAGAASPGESSPHLNFIFNKLIIRNLIFLFFSNNAIHQLS
jgi:hypothetical protein